MSRSMQSPVIHAGPMPETGAPGGPAAATPVAQQVPVQTPSQVIAATGNQVIHITDARGRQIGYKKLGILERQRMFQVAGSDDVQNAAYMAAVLAAFMTVEIDGNQLPPLGMSSGPVQSTRIAMNGRLVILDDAGVDAVSQSYFDLYIKPTLSPQQLETLGISTETEGREGDFMDAVKN